MNWHDHVGALGSGGVAALLLAASPKLWAMLNRWLDRRDRDADAAQAAGRKMSDDLLAIVRQEQMDCKAANERFFTLLAAQGANLDKLANAVAALVQRADQAHDDLREIKGAVSRG